MKTKVIKHEVKFNPVTLEITFESQRELDFFNKLIGVLSPRKAEEITGMNYPEGNILVNIFNSLNEN